MNLWTLKISRVHNETGETDDEEYEERPDVGCFMMGTTSNRRRINVSETREEFIELIEERRKVQKCLFGKYDGETCLSVWVNHQDYIRWAMKTKIWPGSEGEGLALLQEWVFQEYAKESLRFADHDKSNQAARLVQAALDSKRGLNQDCRLYLKYKLDEREEALGRAEPSKGYQPTKEERQEHERAEAQLAFVKARQALILESLAAKPTQPSEQTETEADKERIEAAGIRDRKQINEKDILGKQAKKLKQQKRFEKEEAELSQEHRHIENITYNLMQETGKSFTEARMIIVGSVNFRDWRMKNSWKIYPNQSPPENLKVRLLKQVQEVTESYTSHQQMV